jgi:hypothetical protein
MTLYPCVLIFLFALGLFYQVSSSNVDSAPAQMPALSPDVNLEGEGELVVQQGMQLASNQKFLGFARSACIRTCSKNHNKIVRFCWVLRDETIRQRCQAASDERRDAVVNDCVGFCNQFLS